MKFSRKYYILCLSTILINLSSCSGIKNHQMKQGTSHCKPWKILTTAIVGLCTQSNGSNDTKQFSEVYLKNEINATKLISCINDVYNYVEELDVFDNAYHFFGCTGSGKTTCIAYLMGYKTIRVYNESNGEYFIKIEGDEFSPYITEYHNPFDSDTSAPKCYKGRDVDYSGLCDNAGWQDTGSIETKICRYIATNLALEKSQVRGLINVITCSEIYDASRAHIFKDNLRILSNILKNPLAQMGNIFFLFNKCSSEKSLNHILYSLFQLAESQDAEMKIKKFVTKIADIGNVFIVRPEDGGTSMKIINKALNNHKRYIPSDQFQFSSDPYIFSILQTWVKDITKPSVKAKNALELIEKQLKEVNTKLAIYNTANISEEWAQKNWEDKTEKEWIQLHKQISNSIEQKKKEKENIENDSTIMPYKKRTVVWRMKRTSSDLPKIFGGSTHVCVRSRDNTDLVNYDDKDNPESMNGCNWCARSTGYNTCTNFADHKLKKDIPHFIKKANILGDEINDLKNQLDIIDLKKQKYDLLEKKKAKLSTIKTYCPSLQVIQKLDTIITLKESVYGEETAIFLDNAPFFNNICQEICQV